MIDLIDNKATTISPYQVISGTYQPPSLLALPNDLMTHFFEKYFTLTEAIPSQIVCKRFRKLMPPTHLLSSIPDKEKRLHLRVEALKNAVADGFLNLVKWYNTHLKFPFSGRCRFFGWNMTPIAAKNNRLDLLKWLEERGCDLAGCVHSAAEGGHLPILEWLNTKDVYWCGQETAAKNGHLLVLQWLVRKMGPTELAQVPAAAAHGGHLEVLKWACANGWSLDTFKKQVWTYAAFNGHLHILEWVWGQGYPCDEWTIHELAREGNLKVLQWVYDHGYPVNHIAFEQAAESGHMHVLRWLQEKDCPRSEMGFKGAAIRGRLEVLQWAYHNGFSWDKKASLELAKQFGHEHLVKWIQGLTP